MKYQRRRDTSLSGPKFLLEMPDGVREAKYPGETLALIEAQREAETLDEPGQILVLDEEFVIYTVIRDEHRVIRTYEGRKEAA